MSKADFEKAVALNMATLGLSRGEAEELVRFDNEDTPNEEVDRLTAKAKQNGREYIVSGKRQHVEKVRQVDEDKAHLLSKLMDGLNHVTTIDKVNNESDFSFNFNGANYTVKLIKHR